METIDIDATGAVRHEHCRPCGGTWWKLADERWALVARKSSPTPPPPPAPAAMSFLTEELVGDGLMAQKRRTTGNRRYAAAEILDDDGVRAHLEGHARAAWFIAHPLTTDLHPVAGPTVADVVRGSSFAQLVPFLGQAGELVVGSPSRAYRPLSPALGALITEYAALITAHVAGKSVPCAIAKCKELADRIAWPARPICATHGGAVIRAAVLPEFSVELPAPWPFESRKVKSNALLTGELAAGLTERGRYAPPGELSRR